MNEPVTSQSQWFVIPGDGMDVHVITVEVIGSTLTYWWQPLHPRTGPVTADEMPFSVSISCA